MKNTGQNYIGKRGSKGKLTNVPLGHTGHESSGKLTKDGRVYKNNLLDADWTSQRAINKKMKGVE